MALDDIISSHLDRQRVIESLITLRQEWEVAADGETLTRINGSVGLILADVTGCIGLSFEEQILVLGESLTSESLELSTV